MDLWLLPVGIVGIYVVYVIIMFFGQRSILFSGRYLTPLSRRPTTGVADLESWWVNTEDGLAEAWFIPAPEVTQRKPGPAVIYLHGATELIDHWPKHLTGFLNRGISLLLLEYPGYGRSDGKPSQAEIEEAVVGIYDQLAAHPKVDPLRIIAYGRALGGGVACLLASHRSVAALILESTFISARKYMARYLLPGFLVRDPFDNKAILQEYTGPILIIHGAKDKVIRPSQGQALAQVAPTAQFVVYYCRHDDCPPNVNHYWVDVATFLSQANLL